MINSKNRTAYAYVSIFLFIKNLTKAHPNFKIHPNSPPLVADPPKIRNRTSTMNL